MLRMIEEIPEWQVGFFLGERCIYMFYILRQKN